MKIARYSVIFSLIILMTILFSGCSKKPKWEQLPADVAWQNVLKYYNKGKYLDAIDKLELFLINHAGSAMADSAQFLLAQSHFKIKEYIIAADEYEKTVVQYPQSPLAMEAEYRLGLSFYRISPKYSLDQTYTNKALGAFQLFIEDFPESDLVDQAQDMLNECRYKLARKEYENGRLYSKMKEFASARIYYDIIMQSFYDTEFAPKSQFYKAQSFEKTRQWSEAAREYNLFLDKYEGHEYSEKALKSLNHVLDKMEEEKAEIQELMNKSEMEKDLEEEPETSEDE